MLNSCIEVNNLSKEYKVANKSIFALRDVSLNIGKGEIVGVLGPNGSGKSTLIKVLLSIIIVDDAELRFHCKQIDSRANDKEYLRHIGAIIEGNKEMMERLSAYESAKYYCRLRNVKFEADYFKYLANILFLTEYDKQSRYLSTGNKQKAALINAMIHKPTLILLDEPTLGMDVNCLSALERLIKTLSHDRGVTFVITSHDLNFIERVVQRLICLQSGVKIYDGKLIDFNTNKFLYEINVADNDELKQWLQTHDFGISSKYDNIFLVKDLRELSKIINFILDNGMDQDTITISKYNLEQQFKESTQ